MPMLVVGGDTTLGLALLEAAAEGGGELRAFVTDEEEGARLRSLGVKVARGDVTDASHIEGAALGCFSAVLIADAASDDRERSFGDDPSAIVASWVEAVEAAGVSRIVLVGSDAPHPTRAEWAHIDPSDSGDVVQRILDLDDAKRL